LSKHEACPTANASQRKQKRRALPGTPFWGTGPPGWALLLDGKLTVTAFGRRCDCTCGYALHCQVATQRRFLCCSSNSICSASLRHCCARSASINRASSAGSQRFAFWSMRPGARHHFRALRRTHALQLSTRERFVSFAPARIRLPMETEQAALRQSRRHYGCGELICWVTLRRSSSVSSFICSAVKLPLPRTRSMPLSS